jgi:hypothetical protein
MINKQESVEDARQSGLLLYWVLFLISLVLPVIAADQAFHNQALSVDPGFKVFYLIAWGIMGCAVILLHWRNVRQPRLFSISLVYLGYSFISFFLVYLSVSWYFAGPYPDPVSFRIFAITSLSPLLFHIVWIIIIGNLSVRPVWEGAFLLPTILVLVVVVTFEVVKRNYLMDDIFGENTTINSPDRSYWYIVRKDGPDGENLANSYGFLSPEPNKDFTGERVLLIGDSMAGPELPYNYVKAAQTLYDNEGRRGEVEILNAGQKGYSLDQIKRYYEEKLQEIPHKVLAISFSLDDINRELRYRKNNYLYTPAWPEWMQDVYYGCQTCKLFLNVAGFTDSAFHMYRTRSHLNSLSDALRLLDAIHQIAEENGTTTAVFNLPILNWHSVLSDTADYDLIALNRAVKDWCRIKGISYYDVLPAFIGKDIRQYRVSETDYHFNDRGQRLVAVELKNYLDGLPGRPLL